MRSLLLIAITVGLIACAGCAGTSSGAPGDTQTTNNKSPSTKPKKDRGPVHALRTRNTDESHYDDAVLAAHYWWRTTTTQYTIFHPEQPNPGIPPNQITITDHWILVDGINPKVATQHVSAAGSDAKFDAKKAPGKGADPEFLLAKVGDNCAIVWAYYIASGGQVKVALESDPNNYQVINNSGEGWMWDGTQWLHVSPGPASDTDEDIEEFLAVQICPHQLKR